MYILVSESRPSNRDQFPRRKRDGQEGVQVKRKIECISTDNSLFMKSLYQPIYLLIYPYDMIMYIYKKNFFCFVFLLHLFLE